MTKRSGVTSLLLLCSLLCADAFQPLNIRATPTPGNELKSCLRARDGFLPVRRQTLRGGKGGSIGLQSSLTPEFVMGTLAPLCGNILGNLMFLAPLPSVLAARKAGALGELNPLPFPSLMGNCAAWIAYGLVVKNLWIIAPNVSGILIGLFYTVTSYSIASTAIKNTIVKTLLTYTAIVVGASAAVATGLLPLSPKTVFGLVANLLLLVFYASPLASLATVVKTRNAASLDPLLAGSGVANGLFWTAYGWALRDGYVAIPNGIGAALNMLNLAAVAAFGRRAK